MGLCLVHWGLHGTLCHTLTVSMLACKWVASGWCAVFTASIFEVMAVLIVGCLTAELCKPVLPAAVNLMQHGTNHEAKRNPALANAAM